MSSPRRFSTVRLCMGACVVGGAAILAGCEGEAPEATPAETEQIQKNEMDARRKAYGNSGQQTLKGAKAAAKAGAAAAPAPEAAAPDAAAPEAK